MTANDPIQLSRYVVGLDLGTTNSAMAYVDTASRPHRIQTFAVPQVVAPGHVEARETVPSFHYEPGQNEFSPDALHLPWLSKSNAIVGHFARDHGTLVPGRMIASAKSWLCHNGIDRTANLLPWQGADDVERLSPVTVSARYLQHFRDAWDAEHLNDPLSQQDFVLTLPASFDEVARELTVKAAKQAGLQRVFLIEEPQAAFYAWIAKHTDYWDKLVTPGQKILVCDVGGGTTDFTLIRVKKGSDGTVQFHRVAVGDHLILGGDNLDLALAHQLEKRVKPNGQFEPRQWSVLVRSCRHVKEVLLGDDAPDQWTLTLPGSGSKLIGGSIQVPVTRSEVEELLADGFFPEAPLEAKPESAKSGFQEFGLPYASDPAITKHLASFLTAHRFVALDEPKTDQTMNGSLADDPARPHVLLFNGGVFASPLLRDRLVQALEHWFRKPGTKWTPVVLENERLDLAVARGAAYYGMVRRGEGVRIAAGLARTYYIGVDATGDTGSSDSNQTGSSAMCLVPAGIEPGQEIDLTQHKFQLLISQPIEFPLYVSSTRLTDRPGELVSIDPEQIKALPPIRTVLKTGRSKDSTTVPVILKARLTEIGTLDLWCSEVDGKRSWNLFFDVRSATQTEVAAHDAAGERQGLFENEVLESIRSVIAGTFALSTPSATPDSRASDADPSKIMKRMEEVLDLGRNDWPTSLLRQVWEDLLDCESGRRISAQHEARWLNLVGFSLRPGYGLAVDDWRCNETWKLLQSNLVFATTACRVEWYILWRRIAGGLSAGQQHALTAPLISQLKQVVRQTGAKGKGLDFGGNTHESSELLRLLGACELLPTSVKQDLGEILLELLGRPRYAATASAALWALGRVGARWPVYGPLNCSVPSDFASRWLADLSKLKLADKMAMFATMQLARKTGDRYRDIDEGTRAGVLSRLKQTAAPNHYLDLVSNVTELESDDQTMIFGESLPKGLRIM